MSDQNDFPAKSARPSGPFAGDHVLAASYSRARLTPPRLAALTTPSADPYATRPAQSLPSQSLPVLPGLPSAPVGATNSAVLTYPNALVEAHASDYVARARNRGERHSIALWRAAYHESILLLTRAAVATAPDQRIMSLQWTRTETEYRVAVLVRKVAPPMVH